LLSAAWRVLCRPGVASSESTVTTGNSCFKWALVFAAFASSSESANRQACGHSVSYEYQQRRGKCGLKCSSRYQQRLTASSTTILKRHHGVKSLYFERRFVFASTAGGARIRSGNIMPWQRHENIPSCRARRTKRLMPTRCRMCCEDRRWPGFGCASTP